MRRRTDTGIGAFLKACRQAETAGARAGRTLLLHRGARNKTGLALLITRTTAGLGMQMHNRTPASGNGKDLTVHQTLMRQDILTVGREFRQLDAPEPLQTRLHRGYDMTPVDRYSDVRHGVRHFSAGLRPGVYNGPHFHSGASHINRCLITRVIVREHCAASTRGNGVTMNISTHSRGKHDARCVVSVKDQRSLDSARGKHDLLSADPPKPFTRYRGIGLRRPEMISPALIHGKKIMIVIAGCGGTAQYGDLGV